MITIMQSMWELLLQITVWSGIGVLLLYLVNRFHPLKLSMTAFLFVTGMLVLTIAIWIPWPTWFPSFETKSTVPLNAVNADPLAEEQQKATASDLTVSTWWKEWQKYLPSLTQTSAATNSFMSSNSWCDVVVLFLVIGVAFGILRMILAYRRVQRCLLESHPIQNEHLLAIRNELQDHLRLADSVPILTATGIDVPATCGFRKPVILLPGHWHTWNEAECRSVLAHELAHIKRHDYLIMLISQMIVCLYWFHPLVRWVNHWLRSGQELATDALAVSVLGNRSVYLQSLCRLALRQDGASLPAPARLFLSPEVSLFRRIAMLREGTRKNVLMLNGLHTLMLALAISTGLGIAALRSEANADEPKPVEPSTTTSADWAKYFDPDAPGFVVVRPAAGMTLASMQQHREMLNTMFKHTIDVIPKVGGMGIPLDDVECFAGPIQITLQKNNEKGTGSLTVRGQYFQLKNEAAANAWIRHCVESVKKVDHPQGVYYVANQKEGEPGSGGYFIRPDPRTIVFAQTEKELMQWLNQKGAKPVPALVSQCPTNTGLLTLAINTKHELIQNVKKQAMRDLPVIPMFKPLYDFDGSVFCTVPLVDALNIQVKFCCKDVATATECKGQMDGLINTLKIIQVQGSAPSEKGVQDDAQLVLDLLNQAKAVQNDSDVQFNTHCSVSIGDVLKQPFEDMKGKPKK